MPKKPKAFIPGAELKRIIQYAKGLGVSVKIKPHVRGCGGADWDLDTQEISLFSYSRMSNHTAICYLLHELGHHLDWIYKDRVNSVESEKAFGMLMEKGVEGDRSDIPKKYRKVIYQEELDGIRYMSVIHDELGLKIPLWKVKWHQAMDAHAYRCFYLTGRFLSSEDYREFKQESRKKAYDKYGPKRK